MVSAADANRPVALPAKRAAGSPAADDRAPAALPDAKSNPQLLDRRLLAERYIPYVHSIASKIRKGVAREVPFEDLVEYGMIGLLEAADRYDASHGANFMTFAYYRIRGAIYDGLRGMGWMSRSEYARARFEERANQYLGQLADDHAPPGSAAVGPPTSALLASSADANEAASLPANPLEHAVQKLATAVHGLAAVYITTLDGTQMAAIRDDKTPAAEESLALEQARALVRSTIRKLSEQERQLLEMYYYKDMSLQDVGKKLGLSKSWTSRLHARVIEKLHRMLEESLG